MSRIFKDSKSGNLFLQFIQENHDDTAQIDIVTANTTDAAQEKHVPVVTVDGNTVTVAVGSVAHPMQEEHYITGIFLETSAGGQYHFLKPGQTPSAVFILAEGVKPLAAYEYCNLHGLWKYEIKGE